MVFLIKKVDLCSFIENCSITTDFQSIAALSFASVVESAVTCLQKTTTINIKSYFTCGSQGKFSTEEVLECGGPGGCEHDGGKIDDPPCVAYPIHGG